MLIVQIKIHHGQFWPTISENCVHISSCYQTFVDVMSIKLKICYYNYFFI